MDEPFVEARVWLGTLPEVEIGGRVLTGVQGGLELSVTPEWVLVLAVQISDARRCRDG